LPRRSTRLLRSFGSGLDTSEHGSQRFHDAREVAVIAYVIEEVADVGWSPSLPLVGHDCQPAYPPGLFACAPVGGRSAAAAIPR
jgi:hypothetical protein